MERDAGERIVSALFRDRFVQIVIVLFLAFVVCLVVFDGWLSGLIAIIVFFLGFGITLIVSRRDELRVPSWLSPVFFRLIQKRNSFPRQDTLKCNVCGDQDCSREKIVHSQKPWAGLEVPQEVDDAVENLLNKCLDEYLQSWYTKISKDSSFPMELRQNIRFAVCIISSRLLQADIGLFISHKVIPLIVNHVCISLQNEENFRSQGYRTNKIPYHPALHNRRTELDYLRLRVNEILPLILEHKNLKCNLFNGIVSEVIAGWILLPISSAAETTVLNNLLLILLGSSPITPYPPSKSEKVEFLSNFATSHIGLDTNQHALHPDLCSILKDQTLLYAFMQFLKDQGAVHVLQFCLDVEEFNKKMLVPELSSSQLDLLHRDAWDLFSVYFSPHSPDNIGFPSELVVQMRKVLSKDVTKLRTSPPLFLAYEHAYGLLDKNYCPLFHTSDEFYIWLCGPRTPASVNVSGASSPLIPGSPAKQGYVLKFTNELLSPSFDVRIRRNSRRNEGTVSKLRTRLHKIKGALGPQTVDGHTFDTDVLPLEGDTEFGEELDEEEERDLSSYRIKIHSAETKMDLVTGKFTPTYAIHVLKLGEAGRVEDDWYVERKLVDFYSLEGKLTEFHGDFPDTQLPPCGLLAPSPPTEADVYESYLQKLMNNPSLRRSDLLYRFLSQSSLDFAIEDNPFGRLLRKSVPLTLRKEKGQNIDNFIATFYQSTDTKKTKTDWKEGGCDVKPRKVRCITNTAFQDNLGLNLDHFPLVSPGDGPTILKLKGPSDALLVFVVKIFRVPKFIVRLAIALHSLFNTTLDCLCSIYVDKQLKSLLVPQRIAHLIRLLQWVVFEKNTKSDPKEVAEKVEEKINQLGGQSLTLYRTFFKLVQNQILNKQLLYSLLDLVLDEIFPETAKKK